MIDNREKRLNAIKPLPVADKALKLAGFPECLDEAIEEHEKDMRDLYRERPDLYVDLYGETPPPSIER